MILLLLQRRELDRSRTTLGEKWKCIATHSTIRANERRSDYNSKWIRPKNVTGEMGWRVKRVDVMRWEGVFSFRRHAEGLEGGLPVLNEALMQFPRIRVILSAVFAHGKLKGTMSSGGGGTEGRNGWAKLKASTIATTITTYTIYCRYCYWYLYYNKY